MDLYAWDVEPPDTTRTSGAGGVTGDESEAIGQVRRALAGAPAGTSGVVRRVAVGESGRVAYVNLGTIGRAWLDGASGAVVWARL